MRFAARCLRDGTRDTGCGLKALRRDVYLRLPYFDALHRFMPALVRRDGYDIGYVDVVDRPRGHGVSNYGFFDRLWVGILDLDRRVVADPPQEARSGNRGGLNAGRYHGAVGGYLHDVFVGNARLGNSDRLRRAVVVCHALCRAVDRFGARRPQRRADGVLGVLDRRRPDAARLCALPQGSGVHYRPGIRRLRLSAQSAVRHPQRRHSGGRRS